jgi:hypothetical protein
VVGDGLERRLSGDGDHRLRSSASITVRLASARITTLQGSSNPIPRSALSARYASGGLQAPRIR